MSSRKIPSIPTVSNDLLPYTYYWIPFELVTPATMQKYAARP